MKWCFHVIIFSLIFGSTCHAYDQRGIQAVNPNRSEVSFLGRYYAYIIGINAYGEDWPPLQTAVKDAQELRETLVTKYDFEPEQVFLRIDEHATQQNIINDLKYLASSLTDRDNLLIYYAGHGQIDEFLGDGYWIPVEGKAKNPGTWVSHSSIRNILSSERLKAKNIAVISDSCYSGALLRSGSSTLSISDQDYSQKIVGLSSLRSRQVFTSGGIEPVVDGGRDGHSLFAYYFIKALKDNQMDFIDLENLFYSYVWKPVAEIGNQRPYVGRLKTIMDDNGQFVLLLRSAKGKVPEKPMPLEQASIQPHSFSQPMTPKKLRLAIFPFFGEKNLSAAGSPVPNIETLFNNIVNIIDDIFKEDIYFTPAYSYYNHKKAINKMPDNIITEKLMNQLWISNWYSTDKVPNIDLLCKLGEQLKVDKILTYWFFISSTELIIKSFLIDINEKKVIEKTEKEKSPYIQTGINDTFKLYAKLVTIAILN